MKPDGPIKLVADLLDLPLIDSEGWYCGIVDDVEFSGTKELKLKALLLGPGTYQQRMPGWLYWMVRKVAGDRIVRVPTEKIRSIASAVTLDCSGSELGLQQSEKTAAEWLPKRGAM
jgi:sporulation protein YlmC with PRC-barrel domain